MASSPWTHERTQRLRELHTLGLSTVETARELGITRNACLGKIVRLGLVPHGRAPVWHSQRQEGNVVDFTNFRGPKPATPLPPKPLPQTATAVACDESVPFHSLTPQNCRWPVGEPKTDETPFCGQQRNNGRPYCGKHNRMATISVRRRL
jgi:GcrA cell cycle regulator